MNDIEWESFIQMLSKKGEEVNLKKECKKKGVGLDTLYSKVNELNHKEDKKEIAKRFLSMHPYRPRDIKELDFEQLMRESIIEKTSQSNLASKYRITKRTIQRKFAEIKEINPRLHDIYERYCLLKKGEELDFKVIQEVCEEFQQQTPVTTQNSLKNRREEFLERLQDLEQNEKSQQNANLINHYRRQLKRVEQQIEEEQEKEKE